MLPLSRNSTKSAKYPDGVIFKDHNQLYLSMPNLFRNHFLIVLGHYGHMGGAERQAFHLIEWLRSNDTKVSVLGWTTKGPLTESLEQLGCNCFSFPYSQQLSRAKQLMLLSKLTLFVRNIKPDVILPFVSTHSKPLCTIWRYTGAKYCWWNQQDEGRNLYGSSGEKKALLNAADITSNSYIGAEFLSHTYGIQLNKIKVYNNGTHIPSLPAQTPPSHSWRTSLNLHQEQPLVSMLANITTFKDHTTLLHAWKIVCDHYQNNSQLTPFLALAGTTNDKEHLNALKSLAFDLKLCRNVSFLGPTNDTNQLLFESSIVVHSSVKEGCPNAICEAMAMNRCVVATDISGCRQALGDENNAFLAKPKDAIDLASKILYALGNHQARKDAENHNLRRIQSYFSIPQMVAFFAETISNGLAANSRITK
jgi:glycosyltransferase involved in cell wall biosynthesis